MNHELYVSCMQFDQQLKSGAMSVLEVAPIAARLGARGVEYREIYWRDKTTELPAVRDQIQQLGLTATYTTFTTLFNREAERQHQLMQDLEDARALGSPLLRVFRGERPPDGPDGDTARTAARAFVDQATSYGIKVALENYVGIPGSRPEELREVLAWVDSPMIGTNMDFANYARHGIDCVKAIQEMAPWTIYSHVKDLIRVPNGELGAPLGDGFLPLKEILPVLAALEQPFAFCFEFSGGDDPEGSIVKSQRYLAELGLGSI